MNTKNWDRKEHSITHVEKNEEIADCLKDLQPKDQVVIADAYKYIEKNHDRYDFIWASPPCTKFSVAAIGHHWNKQNSNYYPKKKECVESIRLVYHTLYLINNLNPEYWVMENPRAMLRKLVGMPEGTVTYCQYGDNRMKPTDLWGEFPEGFEFRSCSNGSSCHESAARGSKTGTQGMSNAKERARVPYGLSKSILKAIEKPKLKVKHGENQ